MARSLEVVRAKARAWYNFTGRYVGPDHSIDSYRADLSELIELCDAHLKAGATHMEPGTRIQELFDRTGLI